MREIRAELATVVPPDRIWSIIKAVRLWPEWNPYHPVCQGQVKTGERLRIRREAPGLPPEEIEATLLRREPNRELRWQEKCGPLGLCTAETILEIKCTGEHSSTMVARETMSGLFAGPLWSKVEGAHRAGLERLLAALKERAETPAEYDE
jgi:hypothetical protein